MTYTQDSNKMNSPKQYQLSAIRALREKGLDPDVICGITKTVRQLGREELDHYLTRFLDATKNIPLPILLTWIQGNGLSCIVNNRS